jgi:fumarate reductase flavoprotein subunit
LEIFDSDIAIVGAGGTGLRAAIAVAEADPSLRVALISKVYPMRSHTVAAEGGAAGVVRDDDSLDYHFHDTVAGGDWLCDQHVVEYFVEHCAESLTQLEHWGCPWSRKPDGHINVRAFGGMKVERTWFAADRSGFHMLHTLFQTSLKYDSITRFDEYFCTDLVVDDGRCQGVVAIEVATGRFTFIRAKSVILGTGGAVPAAPAASTAKTPTAVSSPATAWRWPIARARRCATWSSCNSTRPACPAPACCSPRPAAARAACC